MRILSFKFADLCLPIYCLKSAGIAQVGRYSHQHTLEGGTEVAFQKSRDFVSTGICVFGVFDVIRKGTETVHSEHAMEIINDLAMDSICYISRPGAKIFCCLQKRNLSELYTSVRSGWKATAQLCTTVKTNWINGICKSMRRFSLLGMHFHWFSGTDMRLSYSAEN